MASTRLKNVKHSDYHSFDWYYYRLPENLQYIITEAYNRQYSNKVQVNQVRADDSEYDLIYLMSELLCDQERYSKALLGDLETLNRQNAAPFKDTNIEKDVPAQASTFTEKQWTELYRVLDIVFENKFKPSIIDLIKDIVDDRFKDWFNSFMGNAKVRVKKLDLGFEDYWHNK